ncbi:hypothetical protein HGRIS_002153 [Hohenbuehelia grisea]|uniref:Glycosyltransferase family 49 protein n=1 Tax=Hohenbuehelia grisea TaxID=104357 RepID=A0ABR3JKB5_9AGAR
MPFLGRCIRLCQLGLVVYLVVAVLFTTFRLFVLPFSALLRSISELSLAASEPPSPFSVFSGFFWILQYLAGAMVQDWPWNPERTSTSSSELSSDSVFWESSSLALKHGLGQPEPVAVPEALFLSKAFSNSMHPSRIVPFYYRASGTVDSEDITITTLITSNRFKVFAQLAERYEGPISVTIHVENTTTRISELLNQLHTLYTSSKSMATHVDVHLVIDSFDRQFNTWRNIARLFARTNYVMMLDVDFALCTDFRRAIRKSAKMMGRLREGTSAFVLPAFEYTKLSEGTDQRNFPKDKKSLLALIKAGRIGMFHASWAAGHNSTDYDRYYTAKPGEVYKVTQYQSAYEPYVVFRKDGPPWCDERFVGYGGNKAACLFEMYLSGVSFYVLADHFIIHQNHLYEETARKNERKYNRKIYSDFKEETCLRYFKSYHQRNLLNTSSGYNLQSECQKIKGVSRLASQIITEDT